MSQPHNNDDEDFREDAQRSWNIFSQRSLSSSSSSSKTTSGQSWNAFHCDLSTIRRRAGSITPLPPRSGLPSQTQEYRRSNIMDGPVPTVKTPSTGRGLTSPASSSSSGRSTSLHRGSQAAVKTYRGPPGGHEGRVQASGAAPNLIPKLHAKHRPRQGGDDRPPPRSAPSGGGRSKPAKSKFRPRTALQEIKYYQKTTNNLIAKRPFQRVVQEIIEAVPGGRGYRIQTGALQALQQAAEGYLTELFDLSNLASCHGKRVTLMVKDMKLIARVNDKYNL